jgi:proteasome alpha subunit
MYRLSYDGTIVAEPEFLVMGGQADALTSEMRNRFTVGARLEDAVKAAVGALATVGAPDGAARALPANQLEVAVLDRTRNQRKFRRITGAALAAFLPAPAPDAKEAEPAQPDTPPHGSDNGNSSNGEKPT